MFCRISMVVRMKDEYCASNVLHETNVANTVFVYVVICEVEDLIEFHLYDKERGGQRAL